MLKILKYPHPILAKVAVPVRHIDDEFRKIVAEMFQLMYEAEGVGLAGNQVGLPWRFFVMNETADPEQKDKEFVFINPVISKRKGQLEGSEGCLSFPDLTLQVTRAQQIFVQAVNLEGEVRKYDWKGFPARIVQHETDHLNGHCFFQSAGTCGQVKARPILDSLARIFQTDIKMGLVPNSEDLQAEIKKLQEQQK